MVQAGPKIQFGGLKLGLLSLAYQLGMAGAVKIAPKMPIASQIMIENKSLKVLIIYLNQPRIKVKKTARRVATSKPKTTIFWVPLGGFASLHLSL